MADYTNYLDRLAELQTTERIRVRQAPHLPAQHRHGRHRGRHALADRLRAFADRLDV